MAKKSDEKALVTAQEMLLANSADPATLNAIAVLSSRTTPPEAISQHPGKGGKIFSYVAHTYMTKTLLDGLPQLYSHDVLEAHICEDGSAYALVRLQIHIPMQENGTTTWFTNSITEVGAFDGGGGYMPKAMMIASAASRGLAKCMMRRFGIGLDLYRQGDVPTPESNWKALWSFAVNQADVKNNKTKQQELKQQIVLLFNEHEIGREDLVNRFGEAYDLLASMLSGEIPTPEIPVEDKEPVTEEGPDTIDGEAEVKETNAPATAAAPAKAKGKNGNKRNGNGKTENMPWKVAFGQTTPVKTKSFPKDTKLGDVVGQGDKGKIFLVAMRDHVNTLENHLLLKQAIAKILGDWNEAVTQLDALMNPPK